MSRQATPAPQTFHPQARAVAPREIKFPMSDHMIHFNGERFLGPYPDVMPTN